jgi:hypothetical protein
VTRPVDRPADQATVVEAHPEPAEQNATVAAVAEVLMVGVGISIAATEIAAILAPYLIGRRAIAAVLKLIDAHPRATAHRPNARLAVNAIERADPAAAIVRQAARNEVYARASFLIASSSRVQRDVNVAAADGSDTTAALREALVRERGYFARHQAARQRRIDVAAKAAIAAKQYGPVLGWYREPESNSEAECRIADGNNFYAAEGTIIGYPGAVHPNCACQAGPPHKGGRMVNEALTGHIMLVPRKIAAVA